MSDLPRATIPDARALLKLAQVDKAAARAQLDATPPEAIAAAVCEAPLTLRRALLDLVDMPQDIVPLLPEAELCFTCKHVGLEDAAWLLAFATEPQIIACVDLDGWDGLRPSPTKIDTWIAALVEASDETLVRAARALDPEILSLYLRDHVHVVLRPSRTDDDWEEPDGGQTIDGQFYFVARKLNDDLEPLIALLRGLFEQDYWLYFRMLQSVIEELPAEIEEWALRWRTGRMEDLGFPSWDEAMRIYGFLRSDRFADVPLEPSALDLERWAMPVWITDLPASAGAPHTIFRVVGELDGEERHGFFYAFIALANRVAVADRLELSDAETLPATMDKAARVASIGLDEVARSSGVAPVDVVRRVPLERLFRVGVNVSEANERPSFAHTDDEEGGDEAGDEGDDEGRTAKA